MSANHASGGYRHMLRQTCAYCGRQWPVGHQTLSSREATCWGCRKAGKRVVLKEAVAPWDSELYERYLAKKGGA